MRADDPADPSAPQAPWADPSSFHGDVVRAFAYPSVDPGFPALDLNRLMDAHKELITRIKICYGTDNATFENDVLVPVRRYAAFVHLLPATPANYFNEPGGLLRLGLETAFYALQGTDAHIFSGRATIAARRHLEPRWRLATFLAGLCSEIHRTLGAVIVTDHAGNEWSAYLQGLQPWLVSTSAGRFYLKWRPRPMENPGLGLFALPHIVPAPMLAHLAQGNAIVVPHMMASITGMSLPREHNVLGDLVRRAAALVIDRFLRLSADRFGKPQLGSHLERYLVDGLRRLVATHPSWTPNAERSRVWYGNDGMFIVWPNAAHDLRKLLEDDQLPGIPKSAETMLEILCAAGVFLAQADEKPLWPILPPDAKGPLEAVKLADPAIVLAGLEPRPTAASNSIIAPPAQAKSPPAPAKASCEPLPAAEGAPTEGVKDAAHLDAPDTADVPPSDRPRSALSPSPPPQQPIPQQLELPIGQVAPALPAAPGKELGREPAATSAGELSRPAPTSAALRLAAPMRLATQVKAALVDVIDALSGEDGAPQARLTADGLFIAWSEFARRGIAPPRAQQALAQAGMLVLADADDSTPAPSASQGSSAGGLVVDKAFLTGAAMAVDGPPPGR
ncbi:MobH family relaxase [Pseudorhodoferax soli]|uniref:Conjugal transfer pilus assembly protein TraI n=1 Tax=Pseudorhodoferax soli TaxID=545864 RepID=A0A368XDM3_9BURK|nr:MobH family relaxase [Pseudorhodoferax soli]RCW65118.1 conjugal transfer pilus assembly protein TraI [Pseudorhodoferax soli]